MRQIENLKTNGSKPTHGIENNANDWQIHIEGVLKEQAVAKHLNRYWSGKGSTRRTPTYTTLTCEALSARTVPRSFTSPTRTTLFFYFVTGINGVYQIHGGMYAGDAKRTEFNGGNLSRPAFFVPQDASVGPWDTEKVTRAN